jgi:dTDP-4-amino-4,6-dideoxygalactose transaminase
MEEIARAAGHDVDVIEDAAHSPGAARLGRPSGSIGAVAATSFHPGNNLGAYGDGGAVLTSDGWLAKWVRALRNHGGTRRDEHELSGMNSRLDTLQAVVLRAKAHHLPQWNEQRQSAARYYDELLQGSDAIRLPATMPGNDHVWHLYVVRVSNRDAVLAHLQAAGIDAGVHHPVPLHLMRAFGGLGHRPGDFPVAEAAAREILSLPLYPGITASQQERVAEVLVAATSPGPA